MLRLLVGILGGEGRRAVFTVTAFAALRTILGVAALIAIAAALRPLFSGDGAHPVPFAIAAALIVSHLVCAWQLGRAEAAAATSSAAGVALRLARHTERLPLGWFDAPGRAELTELITAGKDDIAATMRFRYTMLVDAAVLPVTAVLAGLRLSPLVGAVLAISAVLISASALSAAKPVVRETTANDEASLVAITQLTDVVQAQPVLRSFRGRDHGTALAQRAVSDMDRAERRMRRHVRWRTSFLPEIIGSLAFAALLLIALRAPLPPAALLVAIILNLQLTGRLNSLGRAFAYTRGTKEYLARVQRVLEVAPLPEPKTPAAPDGNTLTLRGVGFGYSADSPVLHEVSAEFPAGRVTAVVGPSGAGKSTLLGLLSRSWDPTSGSVELGGVDLRDIGSAGVLQRIAVVFQDVFLIDGTLRENVLMARPHAGPAELAAAARLARLDLVVAELPDGWETRVGERGASLSGGQRQRVSIARAFLKDAPIVLLDEPTAALDAENEALLAQALRELGRDRTVVTVTHRLDSARTADQIVVLEGGRIVQAGRHEELVAAEGTYAELWEAHAGRM